MLHGGVSAVGYKASDETTAGVAGTTGDQGFTLIEVMVVVLILGILIGIGTPTFLGARDRAADRSAQASVRTALSTAVLASDFRSDFTVATPAALATLEPGYEYLGASEESTGPRAVSVDATSRGRWVGAALSDSGTCFAVVASAFGHIEVEGTTCAASAFDQPGPTMTPTLTVISGIVDIVGAVGDGERITIDEGYESNDTIFVFPEGATTLTTDLSLHEGVVVPVGTKVCSYLFVYSPQEGHVGSSLTIDLGATILGSARTVTELDTTTSFGNPNADYTSYSWEDNDGYDANGSVLALKAKSLDNFADMIRVFTACP